MIKPVTRVEYDMRGFLRQCLEKYESLVDHPVKFKTVSTPFHDDKIARPIGDEAERRGELQAIASRVLMKVLFAARMARFDLLRATQGLASRVTKWSKECDVALHRLMCYIHSTIDVVQSGFIGDEPQSCKLWLFADSDHAGEHDSRSTSGCILAMVRPNTYFPLTAFSKKQTATAMSSTEAEVIAANLSIRTVGLPSSCLWQVIRNAGGVTNANAQSSAVGTRARNAKKDAWEFEPLRDQVIRRHVEPRNHLFDPRDCDDCPVDHKFLSAQRFTIAQFKDGSFDADVSWDWSSREGQRVMKSEWTGMTIFRIPGPNEIDYGVESREIRNALTDSCYVGQGREGSMDIYLIGKGTFEMVFLEDNQATIRILESGRSPAFRHADKTQRLNLAWLAEQFQRKHFTLVYVPSMLQAADIFTKPFTSSEKWNQLLKILGLHRASIKPPGQKTPDALHPGGPVAAATPESQTRVLLEVCCSPESKLGEVTRKAAHGCKVIRITKDDDVLDPQTRKLIVRQVLNELRYLPKGRRLLVWASLPCTGGTPWIHVNKTIPSAANKVEEHQKEFRKLWNALVDLVNSLRSASPYIAIEWPKGCVYWKLDHVVAFCQRHAMEQVTFDGCMIGVVDVHGVSIRKPWKICTNLPSLIESFESLQCDGNHEHAEGRGESLKRTESYTFRMTDMIHRAFGVSVAN